MVFKFLGIPLRRDAYQQAEQGKVVTWANEARKGDLAFFANDEGRINHVGIMLDSEKIIHASGKVRIDRMDNYGIYLEEKKSYSHKLKVIKRIAH
jgi:cell wall-associated NlpC family hydrolase